MVLRTVTASRKNKRLDQLVWAGGVGRPAPGHSASVVGRAAATLPRELASRDTSSTIQSDILCPL